MIGQIQFRMMTGKSCANNFACLGAAYREILKDKSCIALEKMLLTNSTASTSRFEYEK